MKTSSSSSSSGGVGFAGLLTIVFIVLKLTGFITWPWWWVVAPIWLPLLFLVALFVIGAVIIGIKEGFDYYKQVKKSKKQ